MNSCTNRLMRAIVVIEYSTNAVNLWGAFFCKRANFTPPENTAGRRRSFSQTFAILEISFKARFLNSRFFYFEF